MNAHSFLARAVAGSEEKAKIGAPLPQPSESDIARFFSKIDKRLDDCWIWTASKGSNGYGVFSYQCCKENRRRSVNAHRLAYLIEHGVQPGSLFVCHQCDVRLCVNPDHLFLGTHSDNMLDASRKGRLPLNAPVSCRFQKGHTLRLTVFEPGSKHRSSKLTEEQVLAIMKSTQTSPVLALRFGVQKSTIRCVRTGRSWSHLTGIARNGATS